MMSGRRSSRLKAQDVMGQVNIQPAENTTQPPASKKRKTPAAKVEPSANKKRVATSSTRNNQDLTGRALPGPSSRSLLSLPPEIFNMILRNIKDPETLSKLSRTCQMYYSLAAPQLYKHISTSAPYHANIAKLIRTLEPHLSIRQAQQLKKEGKYKGQSEIFPSTIDPDKKPSCSGHVQQIIVGHVDPGRKHEYIVHRYVEEALKNMVNLQVVETRVLTESITQSLFRLQRLQALNLTSDDLHNDKFKSLTKIKNLQHLKVEDSGYVRENRDEENTVQSLLRNSRSTLKSLDINSTPYNTDFFHDGESNTPKGRETFDFAALNLFALTSASLTSDVVKSLITTIDFVGLRELVLGSLYAGKELLIKQLAKLLSDAQGKGRSVKLRALTLDFSIEEYDMSSVDKQAIADAQCSLISSFDTLTSLVLKNYSQDTGVDHGSSDTFLQAILKHENLIKLRICNPNGEYRGCKIRYLSPTTVTIINTGLLHLKDLEFSTEDKDHEAMGRALALGTSLTSISVYLAPPLSEDLGLNLFNGILKGFLSRNNHSDTRAYKWENNCDLKQVSVDHRVWDLASKFGKGRKGMKKAEKMKGDGGREVMYRDVTGYVRMHAYDESGVVSDWVEKISGDLN